MYLVAASGRRISEFHLVIGLLVDCPVDCTFPLGSILRMSTLAEVVQKRAPIFWIEAINAVPFSDRCKASLPATRQAQLQCA